MFLRTRRPASVRRDNSAAPSARFLVVPEFWGDTILVFLDAFFVCAMISSWSGPLATMRLSSLDGTLTCDSTDVGRGAATVSLFPDFLTCVKAAPPAAPYDTIKERG